MKKVKIVAVIVLVVGIALLGVLLLMRQQADQIRTEIQPAAIHLRL